MGISQGIKLIIFDFDGTLFHLNINWSLLKSKLEDEKKLDLGERIQYYKRTNHPNLQKVTEAEMKAIGDKRITRNVIKSLQALSEHYSLAVLTRNSRQAVERAFEGTKLENKIFIVGREEVEWLKPHPEGARIILHHFDVRPAKAVLVGDTYHDIEAAHKIGMRAIIVENSRLAFRPEGADYYIKDISELARK